MCVCQALSVKEKQEHFYDGLMVCQLETTALRKSAVFTAQNISKELWKHLRTLLFKHADLIFVLSPWRIKFFLIFCLSVDLKHQLH